MPGGDFGLLSPWNVPGVVWVRSTGKRRSDWCHSNSGVGRMHTELGTENGLILSLIRVLLGTCCVLSRVLFSGTQIKNVWSFPHRWWGNKRVNSPILVRSVHLHTSVHTMYACAYVCVCMGACVFISAVPAGSAVSERFLIVASAGSVSVLFLFQTSFSRGFTKNMKLEAVNPRNPGELCVASVIAVKGRLMWLHLEGTHSSWSFWIRGPPGMGREPTASAPQYARFAFLSFQRS